MRTSPSLIVAAFLLTGLTISASQAQRLRPRDIDALPSKAADTKIPYGPDALQFGELRLPLVLRVATSGRAGEGRQQERGAEAARAA